MTCTVSEQMPCSLGSDIARVGYIDEVKCNLIKLTNNEHVVLALVVSGCLGAVRLSLCSFTAMVGRDCLHMYCLGIFVAFGLSFLPQPCLPLIFSLH